MDLVDIHWHELNLRALRRRSRGGLTVRIILPADQRLEHGAVLACDGTGSVVINLLPCDALVIRAESPAQSAQIAYALGNLHLPAEISDVEISLPASEATQAALGRLGIQYELKSRRLRPSETGLVRPTVASPESNQFSS
jgi:urease accessory protein